MVLKTLTTATLASTALAGAASAAVVIEDFEGATLGSTNGNSVVTADASGNQFLSVDVSSGGFFGQRTNVSLNDFNGSGVTPAEVRAFTVDVTYTAEAGNNVPFGLILQLNDDDLGATVLDDISISEGAATLSYELDATEQARFLAGFPFQGIQFIRSTSGFPAGTLTIDNLTAVVPEPA